jgi:hypothetical protein
MGKPFAVELNKIKDTITWSADLDIKDLEMIVDNYDNKPVFIVGSGGSLSACFFAANLLVSQGIFAKAVTPLELFYSKSCIKNSYIILISASGKNVDILFAFKTAIKEEPKSIINICMRRNTKLLSLASKYPNVTTFEFDNPVGKDGFLATNSLVAYYVILYRALHRQTIKNKFESISPKVVDNFLRHINKDTTISVIYGIRAQSVAIDIESKFTEAGLGNILLSDLRNFAHGRHHWFDKRGSNSAIIVLNTPNDEVLSNKTLALMPKSIPKLSISTNMSSYLGTIDLLIKSFDLVKAVGQKNKIDPGKPGVPDYGSKIYNLKYEKLLLNKTVRSPIVLDEISAISILRKSKVSSIENIEEAALLKWKKQYDFFLKKIKSAKFGSIIFDYDSTLCSLKNRFDGLSNEVTLMLIEILKKGFVVAIVSGRGKSLRIEIDKIFPKELTHLKKNVILGYYNGGDIASLTESLKLLKPNKNQGLHPSLATIKEHLKKFSIIPEESPNQLTFGAIANLKSPLLKPFLLNEIMLLGMTDVEMVESSHSMDIIPKNIVSKNNIIGHCKKRCIELGLSTDFLCIGDKGQWPGNDYNLLSNDFSLSVDEVSSNPDSCWNICPPGILNVEGTKYILRKIKYLKKHFSLASL